MTYQPSTGSLILDFQLKLYSTPLTAADIASYLEGRLNDVNTGQNLFAGGILSQSEADLFSKTTGRFYFGPLVHFASAAEAAFRTAA